jgi:hypothetical protein
MEVVGKVKYKSGDIQVSASFKKSELVVTTDEQYPQHILIEFTQDKCDLVDPYQIGENVKVSINLRGREWVNPQGETRYFNQIQGWKIERLQADARQTPPIPSAEAFAPATNYNEDEPDDLPF